MARPDRDHPWRCRAAGIDDQPAAVGKGAAGGQVGQLGHAPGDGGQPRAAATGQGVTELLEEIDRHSAWIAERGELEKRRSRNLRNEVMGIAAFRLRRRLDAAAQLPEVERLLGEVAGRETDPATAAERLLELTGGTDGE